MANSRQTVSTKRSAARPYVVVRVDGTTLTVVDPSRQAKSQADAMQAVVDGLPPTERNGTFGAFLAGGYREKEFTSQQTWETNAKDRQPSFLPRPEPVAAPVEAA